MTEVHIVLPPDPTLAAWQARMRDVCRGCGLRRLDETGTCKACGAVKAKEAGNGGA